MSTRLRRWLRAVAASSLAAAALTAAVPAHAAGGITQTGPAETGNLLDYANSDFEGTTGDWVSVSNAQLSVDTANAFLHDDSLLVTDTGATGSDSFKLGDGSTAVQIGLDTGNKFRVGAYFKAPAAGGQTVQFSLGCYTSAGVWIAWSTGVINTLTSSGAWQYSEDDINVPGNCAFVLGSPKVTLGGLGAGAAVDMDEAVFAPYRAAQIIGAHGQNDADGAGGYTAQDWTDTNTTIGPLQSDKEFYDGNGTPVLPAQWDSTDNVCYEIEQSLGSADAAAWPVCVLAYQTQRTEAQFAAFFQDLPPAQMVIMVFHQEPEGDFTSGAQFVGQFTTQSQRIRDAAGAAPNIFVAEDSASSKYATGGVGADCSYIVPSAATDFYLVDHYDEQADGKNLPAETAGQNWTNWLTCVHEQPLHKPIGLAEYGLDCTTNPDQTVVTNEMLADKGYLKAIPGATEPTVMWEYWYSATGIKQGPGCVFDDSAGGISAWQGAETENGGG